MIIETLKSSNDEAVSSSGFQHFSAESVLSACRTEARHWQSFKKSWDRLLDDRYEVEGSIFRQRRYREFSFDGSRIGLEPLTPYCPRSPDGREIAAQRRFLPRIEDEICFNPGFQQLLRFTGQLAGAVDGGAHWRIEAHQIRLLPDDLGCLPTSAPIKQMGVDHVFITLIDQGGVVGGEHRIFSLEHGRPLASTLMVEPLETLMLQDKQVQHQVGPIVADHRADQPYRDILVLSYRDDDAAMAGHGQRLLYA